MTTSGEIHSPAGAGRNWYSRSRCPSASSKFCSASLRRVLYCMTSRVSCKTRRQIGGCNAFDRLRHHARSSRSRIEDVAAALRHPTVEALSLQEEVGEFVIRSRNDDPRGLEGDENPVKSRSRLRSALTCGLARGPGWRPHDPSLRRESRVERLPGAPSRPRERAIRPVRRPPCTYPTMSASCVA